MCFTEQKGDTSMLLHMSRYCGPGAKAEYINYLEYHHYTHGEVASWSIKFSSLWLITCNTICYKPAKVCPKVI